ncbi:hypothetical protein AAH119_20585 [Bacteroides thetaiotaomicron]|uniref:tetratricopeptide repeat protein n=1 Tax=Bacteroides thetaiotaomicron TaxID=818 RepID=UPI0039B39103
MKCRIILGLSAILFFTGCYNREHISRLDEAEALLQNKPDSALTILKQLRQEGSQAEQARYALLYSEALDKNHIKVTDDSLIRQAWSHYKHYFKDLRHQCKTLYYWGRIKLRAGDKPGALRLFLKIEEKLKDTNEPYYTGLLYGQIGEVYYEQMNYSRAYHYFREARNNFRQSDNVREETESTLDMAAAAFHSKDIEKAMRLYAAALDLADEQKNDHLAKASLTNLASLYVVSGKRQIPHDLLQRIELSARQDTLYGYHTLVDVNLLKNRIDSARYYLALAEAQTTDIRDLADLQYTAYRIEAQTRNFEKATDNIHRYIYLTDSLTRSNMQFSAGMVEREYFKERTDFAEYRMKNRTTWEIAAATVILLMIGVAYYITRQRLRLQRERTDRYLLLAEEANSEYKTLTERMEGQRNTENHLKGLIASRFDIIDKLGKTYYERENTASQQAAMFHEVKQIITDFAENNEMLQELELIVNTCHDNAMQKLRNDFPAMKEADIRLLCYIFVGFSPQVISLFMKDTVANVYARKSRLKSRIKSAETANKDLFLSLFG